MSRKWRLSASNQRRILKMLMELVDQKNLPHHRRHAFAGADRCQETYVIDLDRHINRNVIPDDLAIEGQSTIQYGSL